MSEATKNDSGKLRYDLIPPGPLSELARVYTIGAKKYGGNNWQKGLAKERIVAALMRHMEKYRAGEYRDQEDGQLHLSSVAWCAFALMWYDMKEAEEIDRHIFGDEPEKKHIPGHVCEYEGTNLNCLVKHGD